MDEEVKNKEDVIETQNEVEKDKEGVIEDEVKTDQRTDDDIKGQLDRVFDAIDGITKKVDNIATTVSGFVDYGGVVRENVNEDNIESADKQKKFIAIEDLDLKL